MIRTPAVAGSFYERSAPLLERQLEACFEGQNANASRESFIGGVVPHAGLMYSGRIAAAFYGSSQLPRRLIILCPNHTGLGHPASIDTHRAWSTPLGNVPVDEDLITALMKESRIFRLDDAAHAREHSLEVQLPLLQHVLGRENFTFVPICLATHQYELCEEIGAAIASVVRSADEPVGILASSDLNHYEDQATTLRKDQLAIDAMLALDPRRLWDVVERSNISMCGFIPSTTMLIAARVLGANEATLIEHATSGDVNGDYGHVVGYASLRFQSA